ncbi:MAG: type IV pili methyl-accepting chemotaxis transducer N-terminal domain-containing protein [Xanthomonadales bacterium]|nr:type IV pili methyl-accepting chemotaxis transducer N-terminal domain-containing protein [Xanthomonadales bacterium]
MTPRSLRWNLGTKLALVGLPFLFTGLVAAAIALWLSWQLDGGAAIVNEAGRMRMRAYRLAWTTALAGSEVEHRSLVADFDASMVLLASGDPARGVVTPWNDEVRARYGEVERSWARLRRLHVATGPGSAGTRMDDATQQVVVAIDAFVKSIAFRLEHFTNLLHLALVGLLVLGTLAASVLVVLGYHFVIEPLSDLRRAVARLQAGDLGARLEPSTRDEFGDLAIGFNEMAGQLETSYTELAQRVREQTAQLRDERERLQTLYDVSLLVARCGSLQELADGFVRQLRLAARADAVALRWSNHGNQQFVMLASDGFGDVLVRDEHCIRCGDCLWGAHAASGIGVIPLGPQRLRRHPDCQRQDWSSLVVVPILAHERLIGEIDLFFRGETPPSASERSLLEALAAHLASGMEALRLQALERESAVAEERSMLARELHDSIAQSLAFLNIQAQLMRRAVAEGDHDRMREVLAEIELGLRESHGDVRELLVHFRTRTNVEDMAHALQATLRKFEHQSAIAASLAVHDEGLPLAADVQVQALHIVQEALSNVRKHAAASRVWVDVWKRPSWRIEVRDDGRGFQVDEAREDDETHVGLRIMRERAARLGATFRLSSEPGRGTTVSLTLPGPGADPAKSNTAAGAGPQDG